MKVQQKQRGFTLIELMIVVAIIGILAAIAIPSYQDYTARAQVSEAVSLSSAFKTGLAEYYANGGDFSKLTALTQIGTTISGKYVKSITHTATNASAIVLTATMKGTGSASPLITTKVLNLASDDGGRNWRCGQDSTTILAKHRPAGCK